MNDLAPSRPRVLHVDLSRLSAGEPSAGGPAPWSHADPALDRVGRWSGAALGLALVLGAKRARPTDPLPLVFTVGDCVRRGVPTAVRATVASGSPMDGLYTEGQVGGELALRLAAVADALVLSGRTDVPGAVLLVTPERVELLSRPALVGATPVETWELLVGELGPLPMVRIGPGGERAVPFASLAVGDTAPSFVGRGGLGCVFGRLGLKALVVAAPPLEPLGDPALVAALTSSPRLESRSASGTFELWHAFAARGDLRARNFTEPVSAESGASLASQAAASAGERRGCRGCPTPCGWTFEGAGGRRQRGTFSATYALGPNVGLETFDDSIALLERCDAAGIDAVETGAALALLCRAQELGRATQVRWGDRAKLMAAIDAIAAGTGDGPLLARGASALAAELGLGAEERPGPGGAVRPEGDLAALLAQCVSAAGVDPMRTFPFLTDAAGGMSATLAELVGGDLPAGALDPTDPAGKGRVVFGYENWKAAVDTTGFCAFSAAGLLADGVCDLERLATWIEPPALRSADGEASGEPEELRPPGAAGRALLAAGASVVLLRRELNRLLGADGARDRPAWARAELERPGMLADYYAARGLDGEGHPRPEVLARVGQSDLGQPVGGLHAGSHAEPAVCSGTSEPAPDRPATRASSSDARGERGRVTLRSAGPLARALGDEPSLELELPARLDDVLDAAARSKPDAARYLLRDGRPVPAVYREGRRLTTSDSVRSGDVLDLVVAIRGG